MKSIEKFFDMPMGVYCGVYLREKVAKRVAKLLFKQTQELKELLASDLDQIEISEWTLAYPNGKQETVRFYTPTNNEEKLKRINVLQKLKLIDCLKDGVFIADSMEDAENKYMGFYENIK